MKTKLTATFFSILILLLSICSVFGQARIKDIASFQGMQSMHLIGYGLVIGLDGSGDRSSGANGAIFTVQTVVNMLEKFGITVPVDKIRVRNVAAVMVTSRIDPFLNPGTKTDVTVSSLGDAKSLEGGMLLTTPLLGSVRCWASQPLLRAGPPGQ